MATAPRSEFDLTSPFSAETPVAIRISELVRLQKSAQRITSTLNLDEIVQRVVEEVSDSLEAVEINLYLRDPEQNELVLAGVCGCTMYCRGHRLKIGEQGMAGHVAATRKLHYAPDVRLDPYYIACEPATRSEVAIPLEVDGELVGVFSASHHDLDAFCETQLRLLQGLCSHIAVAVQNAHRFHLEQKQREKMTREAEEARLIQQALLPRTSPLIPGFVVSGQSVPAGAIGGDWYDFIPLPEGRWGLVLADVSGKGTAAALLMSATRGMLRSLASRGSGPAEVLTRLNNMLLEDFPDGRFVTMVYAELDPQKRTLRLANAGHLAPLLVWSGSAQDKANPNVYKDNPSTSHPERNIAVGEANGDVESKGPYFSNALRSKDIVVPALNPSGYRWIQTEQGLPLGISTSKYSETEIKLAPGSRVAFYSDGITEAELDSGEEYGPERLLAQLQSPDFSPEGLLADVKKFVNGAGLRDDATVILVGAKL
jgi:phosphoserine phosphatase RsbU/P